MLKQLFRLANLLDREGFQTIADEVDALIKAASGRTDEEIDKSVDEYFANPEIQERNQIEREYGLDEDDMFGLERTPWHGYKYNYEGIPAKDKNSDFFKPFTRYHTVIVKDDEQEPPDEIPDTDGVWQFEQLGPAPEGSTYGGNTFTYRFVSNKEKEKEKEMAPFKAEIEKMLAEPDEEITELPEEAVEVVEEETPKKQHGGGVKLF